MNAWMARAFPQFERSVAIVSSDMLITEPRPDLLDEIGLTSGVTVLDSRIFVHYYHNTPDGRIMLGKGGNTFAYGGRMLPVFDQPSPYAGLLQSSLADFFPAFAGVKVEATWNGPSDRSVTGLPFFGQMSASAMCFTVSAIPAAASAPATWAGRFWRRWFKAWTTPGPVRRWSMALWAFSRRSRFAISAR